MTPPGTPPPPTQGVAELPPPPAHSSEAGQNWDAWKRAGAGVESPLAEATPRSHRCGAFCPSSRANGATPTPSPARSAADKPGARRPTGHAAAADSPQPASRVGNCTLREAGKGKSHWHHAEGGRAREGSGQLKKALKPGTFGEGRDTQQAEGRRGQCSWAAAALQGRRWRAASGGRRGGGASMRGGCALVGRGEAPPER